MIFVAHLNIWLHFQEQQSPFLVMSCAGEEQCRAQEEEEPAGFCALPCASTAQLSPWHTKNCFIPCSSGRHSQQGRARALLLLLLRLNSGSSMWKLVFYLFYWYYTYRCVTVNTVKLITHGSGNLQQHDVFQVKICFWIWCLTAFHNDI